MYQVNKITSIRFLSTFKGAIPSFLFFIYYYIFGLGILSKNYLVWWSAAAKPMLFAGFYPFNAGEYKDLRAAIDKLCINDNSVTLR